MRQATEHEYIGQVNFDLIKRLHDANRHITYVRESNDLFIQGLEALMYHPLKDDLFVFVKFVEESGRCKSISVWDYASKISDWSIHEPDGETRSKLQLQISYTYDVQKKRPRNSKRSCNPKAIKQMVSEIRTIPIDKLTAELVETTNSLIRDIPEIDNNLKLVNNWFKDLYYSNSKEQLRVITNLAHGGDGGAWDNVRNTLDLCGVSVIEAARTCIEKSKRASDLHASYSRHRVGVSSSPMGKYKVIRHIVTNDCVDTLVNIYPSKEALPADVLGNLSVIDIAQSAKSTERDRFDRYFVRVEGVGYLAGHMENQYYLIGENFVDPRIESQGQGSQTS